MTRAYFGTDGIRGRANTEPMTAEIAMRVAMAAGLHFREAHGRRPLAVIGKDTRLSGYMLESAMMAGFTAIGMDVVLLGPIPTPAVAMLTSSLRADLGVMISASHNPYYDNGIKLFGPDGYKLSDAVELAIETRIDGVDMSDLAPSAELGRARRLSDGHGRYIEAVKGSFGSDQRLRGLKIVVDCAHGAAYEIAPAVLYELGADVVTIGNLPDGFNINDQAGATDPHALRARVVAERADLGIAVDGDADRLVMVDEIGRVVDGDQILGLIGRSWHRSGRLRGGGVVATVMSNLGLERALARDGLTLARTKVGDRYVLEHMRANNFNIGGEQSGHLIFTDHGKTGDGILAALQVLEVLVRSEERLSKAAHVFDPAPQLLKTVRFSGPSPLDTDAVTTAINDARAMLGDTGRVLVRKSGTEPAIRVMAEGDEPSKVNQAVDDIVAAIETAGS